ncbi:glycoside hydrolase family 2 TIM barrel-domain containing protein [Fulvivirga ligni]|uniref:glycoside hydrolase family 2 TIM barrel-domain containing protein n=1 Tax=Fulvivirga ligni TaxID=2904246 RepID=UPI001EEF5DF8|nr:glycoside hydrolase family 2 TIM barrel-domain containing protein [Fulvivirga ligni]UII21451.1 DUF4982 domain-containing protein [Fulvivirga ligni]
MNPFKLPLLLLLITSISLVQAQSTVRQKISINSGWKFHQGELTQPFAESVDWQHIALPHSWNAQDATDEEPGYYRGEAWYTKELSISPNWKGKKLYLFFEGANQEAEVFVNGQKAGSHIGGYTRFAIPMTNLIDFEKSTATIAVKLNNRHNEEIPPLEADFTFFGGIYRDVYVVALEPVHTDLEKYASSGVQITTPQVSTEQAEVEVMTHLVNEQKQASKVEVQQLILDADKKVIAKVFNKLTLKPGLAADLSQNIKEIKNPHLWSIEDPYLYTVVTKIIDSKSKQVLDEVENSLGFRWFKFDGNEGFSLNGKHVKLIGTNRHQDYLSLGNALPDALHINDIKLLKAMGGNFLRIAHYPQDPTILEMCDKLGIITSVEIPIVNRVTESEVFLSNCKQMMTEMIRQNFNHPSVVIWAYMNEVLLRPRYGNDSDERKAYYKEITRQAQELENLIRKEDPTRYTMIPNHGWFEGYRDTQLTQIPMIVGWNLYPGWYGADIHGLEKFLERHHQELSDKPLIITEYGAGADPRLHSFDPKRFDFTVEYETYYHKHYVEQIKKYPFVAGANVWNLNDFYSSGRRDAVPQVNNKGLVTQDRRPKDAFYYYQAALWKEPFVGLGSKIWQYRAGVEDAENTGVSSQEFEVYSNLDKVNLFLNGQDLGEKQVNKNVASWKVPFKNGINWLEAIGKRDGKKVKDFMQVNFQIQPYDLKSKKWPFEEIRISLGDHRYFVDDLTHEVWMPDQMYKAGQWGEKGDFQSKKENPSDILGTNIDPIYQTQQYDIKEYQLDVPAGKYEVTFYFAELLSNKELEKLVYNLGNDTKQEKASKRVFDVYINGNLIIDDLNLAEQYGERVAVEIKTEVFVEDEKGLQLTFDASAGQAVLNGLKVRKEY